MAALQPEYRTTSDSAVTAVFGHRIDAELNAAVIGLFRAIQAGPPAWLENLHPAYASLQVDFDPDRVDHAQVIAYLAGRQSDPVPNPGRILTIPVVYDGPDLADVAAHCRLTPAEVIALHSTPDYRVAFLGFVPGFAYLMGLPAALETPRLAVPRTRVPAGSVAIGGAQTGIYPAESPGGWRIIGRSSLKFPPAWAEPGDTVRFEPI